MRFLTRSLIGLFLLAATVAILGLAGRMVMVALDERMNRETPVREARERVFAVNVVTAEAQDVTPVIATFGAVETPRMLELRAPAGGEIVWLAETFEDGAEVAAGAPLLRIDAEDATGRRDSARADLAEAEADLRDARRALDLARDEVTSARDQATLRQRALERQRNLQELRVGTEAAVETAELAAQAAEAAVLSRRQALAQAEARVDQALTTLDRRQIALAEADRRLEETELTAPFAGRLAGTRASLGGLVTANERVADLMDLSVLDVVFTLSASQYARLLEDGGPIGAPVTVALGVEGFDLRAEGRITRESAAVGEGTTGRRLYARLDGAAGFRPGDFVELRITEPDLSGVAVLPATALDAAETVLAVGEEGRLVRLSAPLLRRQGDTVIVSAGEIAGRDVVAVRTPFLGEGIRIRPLRPDAEAAAEEPEFVTLDPARRDRLIAFVENVSRMPDAAKARVLAQLQADRVPAGVVARLEARMGG